MAIKKKLKVKLDDIKVESFNTSLDDDAQGKIKGGDETVTYDWAVCKTSCGGECDTKDLNCPSFPCKYTYGPICEELTMFTLHPCTAFGEICADLV